MSFPIDSNLKNLNVSNEKFIQTRVFQSKVFDTRYLQETAIGGNVLLVNIVSYIKDNNTDKERFLNANRSRRFKCIFSFLYSVYVSALDEQFRKKLETANIFLSLVEKHWEIGNNFFDRERFKKNYTARWNRFKKSQIINDKNTETDTNLLDINSMVDTLDKIKTVLDFCFQFQNSESLNYIKKNVMSIFNKKMEIINSKFLKLKIYSKKPINIDQIKIGYEKILRYNEKLGNKLNKSEFRDSFQDVIEEIFFKNNLENPFLKFDKIPSSYFGITYKDQNNKRNYYVSIGAIILYDSFKLDQVIEKFIIYNQILPKIRLTKGSKDLYMLIGCLSGYDKKCFIKGRAIINKASVELAAEINDICILND
uniref:Transposase n=1 Tax=Strongyloides stercoralis TaxID=6248 RepID=A0A0K0EBY5_STRER